MPVQITLRDRTSWHQPLNPIGVALMMMHLLNHDFRVNEKTIFPNLGIDMKTRLRLGNIPNIESRRTHEYRIVNKALAMELLSGLMLTHLNSASQVINWCQTHQGLPHSFAPSGYADVEAHYGNASDSSAFRVIAEVSAKRHVSPQFFSKQLDQAWRHATEMANDAIGGKVYALVINGGNVIENPPLSDAFREFVKPLAMGREYPVSVIPVCAADLSVAVRRIVEELPNDAIGFTPSLLASIFRAILEALFLPKTKLRADPDRLCNIWVDAVKTELELKRSRDSRDKF